MKKSLIIVSLIAFVIFGLSTLAHADEEETPEPNFMPDSFIVSELMIKLKKEGMDNTASGIKIGSKDDDFFTALKKRDKLIIFLINELKKGETDLTDLDNKIHEQLVFDLKIDRNHPNSLKKGWPEGEKPYSLKKDWPEGEGLLVEETSSYIIGNRNSY